MNLFDGYTIVHEMLYPSFAHTIKYSIVSALETCKVSYDNPKRGTVKFAALGSKRTKSANAPKCPSEGK